jgi:hypothetical protein
VVTKPVFAGTILIAVLTAWAAAPAAQTQTVRGEVVDLQCSLEKGSSGRGEAHGACAMDCARRGRQLAILADDGVYVVAGDYTANDNAKLLDFVARRVEAKGQVADKDGRKVITVASMAVVKDQD